MPNWTSNIVRVEGDADDILEFLDTVSSPESLFDFDRIIPMPEILKNTGCGHRTIDGKEVRSWYIVSTGNGMPDEIARLFTPAEEAVLAEIGHCDWYSWCNAHWGTKWNAVRTEISEKCLNDTWVEFRFETAWDAPLPVFRRMFDMFPRLAFSCSWQHEGEDLWHALETQAKAEAA